MKLLGVIMKYSKESLSLDFTTGVEFAQLKRHLVYPQLLKKTFHAAIPYQIAFEFALQNFRDYKLFADLYSENLGLFALQWDVRNSIFIIMHMQHISGAGRMSTEIKGKEFRRLKKKLINLRDKFLFP